MKIFVTIVALVAAVNAKAVVPVMQQNQILPPGQVPTEYGPPPPVQPLTPFNAPLDGYYGYNPYINPYNPAFYPQAPFLHPAYNNFNPLAYQVAMPNPYAYPGAYPQLPQLYPGQIPQLPLQVPFPGQVPQLPQQVPFPGQLPQLPGPIPPFARQQQLNVQPQQQTQVRPHSPAPSVSYSSFQLQHPTSSQPAKPAVALAGPVQGVNGAPKPVSAPQHASGNQAAAYGSAFGKYVSAASNNAAAAVPQQPGTVLTAPALPGRGVNQNGAQGVNVAQ
ncbi:hypothetical protein quinque_011049 [Culex quinquefasciatus]